MTLTMRYDDGEAIGRGLNGNQQRVNPSCRRLIAETAH
jgi:hypothetical protein